MIADNWYETFFTNINCEMWEKAGTPEWTAAEVIFLKDVLQIKPGQSILDIPCGTGRHSLALAAEGHFMTAVDISDEFIKSLRLKATGLPVKILLENILSVSLPGPFDAAFCIGNRFGYFPFPAMQEFVKKVSGQLKTGGRWVINSGLIAESFLVNFVREKSYELPGLTMHISNDYDIWNSCLLTTLTYSKQGNQNVQRFKHHLYTVAELIRLLEAGGLKTIALYSDLKKTPYAFGGPQLFLVCEKS